MNGFYKISEWIMRFSVVNVIWLLFNLPIVVLVINMFKTNEWLTFSSFFIFIIVLAPFLFFPATAAMFACARDWIMKRDGKSLWKEFWLHYKNNYKQSVISGGLLTVIWTIWVVDMYFFHDVNTVMMLIFLIMGLFLFVYTVNFFSVVVHYNMALKLLIINTFLITVGSPIIFFVVLISSVLIFYANLYAPLFIMVFFSGTLYAFVNFSSFYRVYTKLNNKST